MDFLTLWEICLAAIPMMAIIAGFLGTLFGGLHGGTTPGIRNRQLAALENRAIYLDGVRDRLYPSEVSLQEPRPIQRTGLFDAVANAFTRTYS